MICSMLIEQNIFQQVTICTFITITLFFFHFLD